MQHLVKRRLFAAVSSLVFATAGVACSDSGDDDDGSNGGSSGSSTGGSSASGGSSATGGSGGSSASGGSSGSSTGKGGSSGSSTGKGGTSSGGSSGSSTGKGGSGGSVPPGAACPGLPVEDGAGGEQACTGFAYEVEPVPVDLFIMMDRSVSMNELLPDGVTTRWEALHDAVEAFVGEDNDQLRVGISFFNRTGAADDNLDCDVDFYATPVVEIGDLDEAGPDILTAMEDTVPGGLTPTLPALQGAIQHAAEWAEENPGRATAVLLVTDGYPTQCQAVVGINEIAAVAADGYKNAPYIRTYVVGLAADFNLDNIAISGGTNAAYLVDEGDVAGSFSAALKNVAGSKLACEYELPTPPAGMNLNLDEVQIVYTTASTDESREVPRITSAEACVRNPNGGWFYDDPEDPTKIQVCPCTCQSFQAGTVDVRVGCVPAVGIR